MLNLTFYRPNDPTLYSRYFDTDAEIDAFIGRHDGIRIVSRDFSARCTGNKYF